VNRYKSILEALKAKSFSHEEAKALGDKMNVDWDKIDLEQFHKGLNVELEHGTVSPATDITNNDVEETAKIALAHLNEVPDYYTKLKKVEK
jgi:Protein of unknown function (DUF5661)